MSYLLFGGLVLNLYTFFLAVVLILFRDNDRKTASNAEYLRLVGVLAFLVGVSCIGDVGNILGGNFVILSDISSYIAFALDPLGFLFALRYIDCFTVNVDRKKKNLFIIPVNAYCIFNFAVVTISSVFDLHWFYYYEGTQYYRGQFYLARGLFQVMLCFAVVLFVVVFRKNIIRNYRLPIMLFPLIVAFGGFMQVVVICINLEYAAAVFSCLLLLIYVQRRDVNMDYLTGVVNRRGIDMALRRAIRECRERDFAAIMIDIDFFKKINDSYGHRIGDEVLECIAGVLKDTFGREDIVGRFGGDEFCVITKTNDKHEIERRIKELKESIALMDWSRKDDMDLSISTGIAMYDKDSGMKAKDFMESVDRKMYEEKIRHHLSDRRKQAVN